VHVMKNIRPHPHIVQLLGACTQNANELCLVMEFCSNGSLERMLRTNYNIPQVMKLRWIKGIAAGLYHLSKVGLVHRDLAARNILLDDNCKPKIADFGLARLVNNSMAPTTTKNGTF
jgi:serine/threonine protein kinase